MTEITEYYMHKKKMEGICDEAGLNFRYVTNNYPTMMIFTPVQSMENQMSMLETDGADYTSPSAKMIITFEEGDAKHHYTGAFTISERLRTKIMNRAKKMHKCWMEAFYRELCESGKDMNALTAAMQESEISVDGVDDGTNDDSEFEDELDGLEDEFDGEEE